jgi:hypothetical protein
MGGEMMKSVYVPEKNGKGIGNFVPGASIKIIDEDAMKWKTVWSGIDTPIVLESVIKEMKKKYKNLWLFDADGKHPLF